ncbi:MAG TPA: uroporphyrinogen-III synthase [Nitrososphaerales archaeon]|nr:uroporphyrinogen-III synthase [Nitrososphaerales archaeon]
MKAQTAPRRGITKVAITRSGKGNLELSTKLKALGYEPIPVETMEFLPPEDWSAVDGHLGRLSEFDWLVFTSATGAECFVSRLRSLSIALPPPRGRPAVAVVGAKTEEALVRQGVGVDFVPSSYLSSALAEELPTAMGKRTLVLRADMGDTRFIPRLRERGFEVADVAIYRTSALSGSEAALRRLDEAQAIVFASPSAVGALSASLGPAGAWWPRLAALPCLCIGPVTAEAARAHGFARIYTSTMHTLDGVLELLETVSGAEGSM